MDRFTVAEGAADRYVSTAGHSPRGLLGCLIGFAIALAVQYLIVHGVDALFPSRAPLPSGPAWLIIPTLAGSLGWEIFSGR